MPFISYVLFPIVLLIVSCGPSANMNKYFGEDESLEALMVEAQVAYDAGNFDEAKELALQAQSLNTQNGDVAVLLGYIYLSEAGIDPFILARKLTALGQTSSASDSCTPSDTTSSTASLQELSCRLVTLSAADVNNLGTFKSAGKSKQFKSSLVFVPNKVDDTMRSSISVLNAANLGVKALCRFVDSEVLSTTDERHTSSDCTSIENAHVSGAKAHLIFALLHLSEIMVFQNSLLVDSNKTITSQATSGKTVLGMQGLATKFSSISSTTNVIELVSTISDVKTTMDELLDTSSTNSQLSLLVSGLKTVSRAFAHIDGLPEDISSTITKSIASIENLGSQISSSVSQKQSTTSEVGGTSLPSGKSAAEIEALKSQLSSQLNSSVVSQINSYTASKNVSTEDKETLCTAYASMATEGASTTPTACQ